MLRIPSFKNCLPLLLAAGIAHGQTSPKPPPAPHFTLHDAIRCEWMRVAPTLNADALSKTDRERYQLTLQRIGAPGMPKLLPPELENPTVEIWEAKAKEAKTPQERFTALHFLNRLKSPKALSALDGLKSEDAKTWPKHLYLDANIATARLQGGEVSKELQNFLDTLQAEGKVEPVRAQAARLRLVMAGKEKELLPLIPATPGAVIALLDAWNRAPWEQRKEMHPSMNALFIRKELRAVLGLGDPPSFTPPGLRSGLFQRWLDGFPDGTVNGLTLDWLNTGFRDSPPIYIQSWGTALSRSAEPKAGTIAEIFQRDYENPIVRTALMPTLKKWHTTSAREVQSGLLKGPFPIARSAAIEDLPEAPADLDALTLFTWKDRDLEPQQTLIESYSRWKLPKEKQIELLKPWLQHPDWACRFLAYQQLAKLDPATTWPTAPEPNEREKTLLKEAERLASKGKPLRFRITFSGKRQVTLRLDPTAAPINVANLAMLARKGFFNGRLVPRVVPDFVVQMGSPYDTMDGGPGYTVRCENSLNWYGPGSVGMALSGKDTGGSQFFITTNATPHLTGKYTRMGEVEDLDRALKILDDLELGAKIEQVEVLK